tara:strand:+ start:991 stop:1512 length:522 start_codon:yes stop_codon:yes gene_type:complete
MGLEHIRIQDALLGEFIDTIDEVLARHEAAEYATINTSDDSYGLLIASPEMDMWMEAGPPNLFEYNTDIRGMFMNIGKVEVKLAKEDEVANIAVTWRDKGGEHVEVYHFVEGVPSAYESDGVKTNRWPNCKPAGLVYVVDALKIFAKDNEDAGQDMARCIINALRWNPKAYNG